MLSFFLQPQAPVPVNPLGQPPAADESDIWTLDEVNQDLEDKIESLKRQLDDDPSCIDRISKYMFPSHNQRY